MISYVKPGIDLKEDSEEINKIFESGQFCLGEYTKGLEEFFKDTYGVKYAVTCCNATSGLIVAVKAAGIKNMRVGLPSFTWPSTLYALECNNNTPVFFDIDIYTWLMDIDSNKAKVDAYIAVDTFGNADIIETDLPVLYDAAHSFGNTCLCNRGVAEVVSFSFTKPVTGMQGGIILTNDFNIYEEAKELVRLSAKMCEINAFICLKNIASYQDRYKNNMKIIDMYQDLINIEFDTQESCVDTNNSTFAILVENEKRDRIYDKLKKKGVETKIYYDPLTSDFKNTNEIFSKIICLPVYKDMYLEVPKICKIINEA